jgi:hypothetical protein
VEWPAACHVQCYCSRPKTGLLLSVQPACTVQCVWKLSAERGVSLHSADSVCIHRPVLCQVCSVCRLRSSYDKNQIHQH